MLQNILIVDDDKDLLDVLILILEKSNYGVFAASDAIKAVAILERKTDEIDLIVSDVDMPGMSGLELARLVKIQYPNLPVILSSARDYGQEANNLGAEFIGKPYTVETLLEMISTLYPQS